MDAQLYSDRTNVPHAKDIVFKFFVDAANAPTLDTNPANLYVTSVSRVSQGLFRLTLNGTFKKHLRTTPHLNVNAAGVALWAQPGPVANVGTSSAVTVDILVVDNAGAVQDPPAANSDNFISGTITFSDVSGV